MFERCFIREWATVITFPASGHQRTERRSPCCTIRKQRHKGGDREIQNINVHYCDDPRPQLNRLLADARKRRFDVIAVWKLDRFWRSLKHLVMTLADLESLGIAFVSLRDSFDLSTPSGRLLFQLVGAMAEFEGALIQERVRAGLKNAKAKGRKLG